MTIPILSLPDSDSRGGEGISSSVLTVSNRLRVVPSVSLRADPVRVFELLSSVGEVQQVDFTAVQEEGVVSVTYFDMRSARRALMELVGDFKQLDPDMSYDSLGNRSVRINRDPSVSLDDTMNALGKYGEIERISFAGLEQLVVEFFDTRGPIAVMTALSSPTGCTQRPAIGGEARRANYSNPPVQLISPSLQTASAVVSMTSNLASGGRHDSSLDFEIDIERIASGADTRTTLMIRNIPNKYAQKNLLKLLDLRFRDKYDFFYLPIDYKNKCNVGYAFINFTDQDFKEGIVVMTGLFNNKKWEKFNSEKVCKIAYARLQGQDALLDHFKSSSVMQQHKQLRPFFTKPEGFPVSPPPGLSDQFSAIDSSWCGGSDVSGFSLQLPLASSLNPNTVEGSIYLSLHSENSNSLEKEL